MNIILLSISPDKSGNRQRTDYLADCLKGLGHNVFIVRWTPWREPRRGHQNHATNDMYFKLLPSGSRLFKKAITPFWNKIRLIRYLRDVTVALSVDLLIWPNNWYVIGYPPAKFRVPIVIDYFDLLDVTMEKRYFSCERYVWCTSMELTTRASRWTDKAIWIPTPVETNRFSIDRTTAKKHLGLTENQSVVSLIGLTASPELYFIDAIDELDIGDVRCLFVGEGELLPHIRKKLENVRHPDRFVICGRVPYDEVPYYFCATDVGLYPGEDDDYYHSACPIKVIEYLASGADVVANNLRELKNWNINGIHLVDATSEGFRCAIQAALVRQRAVPKGVGMFSRDNVSRQVNDALKALWRNRVNWQP